MGDNRVEAVLTTRQLTEYYVIWRLNEEHGQNNLDVPPPSQSPTKEMLSLRNLCSEFETTYRLNLDDIFRTLIITEENAQVTFCEIINELFSDGIITWGRIVAMFTYAGVMAVTCAHNGMPAISVDIIQWLTDYVDQRLMTWINSHGAWDGFMEFYREREGEDSGSNLKKLFGCVGLAVGAVGVLTIGSFLASKT